MVSTERVMPSERRLALICYDNQGRLASMVVDVAGPWAPMNIKDMDSMAEFFPAGLEQLRYTDGDNGVVFFGPMASAPHPAPAARGIGFRALAAVLWLGAVVALAGCALRDDGHTEWVWPTFGL